MTLDLSTARGVLNYAQRQRDSMVDEWRKNGRFERNGFSYGVILFATHGVRRGGPRPEDWKPGSKLPAVKPVPVALPADFHRFFDTDTMAGHTRARTFFAHAVKTYAALAKAVGVLFMGEMWMVTDGKTAPARGDSPEEHDRARRELQQFRETLPADLGEAPQRMEGLYMHLEHVAMTERHTWRAEIRRDPSRVEPWEAWTDPGMYSEGRFVDLVEWRT